MPYITREDGEHFVIPSYRDVLDGKNKNALKKEILTLSQSYGEYITLQSKGPIQYEVAFSPDTGYLLGESIWHQFKKPIDMIYCEAIPNTTEAILVIVKSGSVYLDGSFPVDSIPEELIIFLTQQNNFEIYTYGDVPISQEPEDGKFSFEAASVKSFTVLENPVFPTLPLLKIYQLRLVDPVLTEYGIGVFPTKRLLTILVIAGLFWMLWTQMTSHKNEVQVAAPKQVDPYLGYNTTLASPAPDDEIKQFLTNMQLLYTMPGWIVTHVEYAHGVMIAKVISPGSKIEALLDWANQNDVHTDIKANGIYLTITNNFVSRPKPDKIYSIKNLIATFTDRLADIYPGNHLSLGDMASKGVYTDMVMTLNIDSVTPTVLSLIGGLCKDMPFVLQNVVIDLKNGSMSGSLNIEVLGS